MATTDKYDRQLRLWGSHGQRALMSSHLLLFGATAVGAETLKNLVLPGVGKITICDDQRVTASDMGNNFFVAAADIGKYRAEVVTSWLCEMNTDVNPGAPILEDPHNYLIHRSSELSQYALIIAANQPRQVVLVLAKHCWDRNIPLLVVQSYGFIGYLRLQIRIHDVIEGKPEPGNGIIHDIRVSNAFPELEAFAASIDLASLDPYQHKHVPYIVILIKVLHEWKRTHHGQMPTSKDRAALVSMITALSDDYRPKDTFPDEASLAEWEKYRGIRYEENFQEALKNVSKLWAPKTVRADLRLLIESEVSDAAGATPSEFSILLRALHAFRLATDGQVPHKGDIPDMVSTTAYFVALQRLFEMRARRDNEQMRELANAFCTQQGLPHVDQEVLDLFCKNVFDIARCECRSIEQEFGAPCVQEMQAACYDPFVSPEQTPITWYFVLQAAHTFYENMGRYPGQLDSNAPAVLQGDVERVWDILQAQVAQVGLRTELIDSGILQIAHAQELVRYAAVEMHNISAIIGGIGGQEAVKLLTHQYIPIDNTYVYNGIACVGAKYAL